MSPFQIVFAGRLDEFKDPPLMFRTIERLRQKLNGAIRFHYIGTSDPHRFSEFAAIEDITIRHGFKDAMGMAKTLAGAHAGILTSEFEGMPRCVLETLAVGRPVVAMHLPQLESVIHDDQSGFLVTRDGSREEWAETLAQRFIDVRDAIDSGELTPERVADAIQNFTPATQLARVYRYHQEIQDARGFVAATAS
jgi:glycosyltransferase involved in cell wall biosynthesis